MYNANWISDINICIDTMSLCYTIEQKNNITIQTQWILRENEYSVQCCHLFCFYRIFLSNFLNTLPYGFVSMRAIDLCQRVFECCSVEFRRENKYNKDQHWRCKRNKVSTEIWSVRGIIHWEHLPAGCTITADLYCQQLQQRDRYPNRDRHFLES